MITNESFHDHVKALLKYNWEDELDDYLDQRFDGMEPNADHHIFTRMALISRVVDGHKKTAEDLAIEFCDNNGITRPGEDS